MHDRAKICFRIAIFHIARALFLFGGEQSRNILYGQSNPTNKMIRLNKTKKQRH